jgi:hypothetical protein
VARRARLKQAFLLNQGRRLLLAGLVAFCGAVSAEGLIGETLTFSRAYPTPTTPFWSPSSTTTTVAEGFSDQIVWQWVPGVSGVTTINPEASAIAWGGWPGEYIGEGEVFDGFVVSGFSRDIASVEVVSSGGFAIELTPGARSFGVSLRGVGSSFALAVQLVPVPEPHTFVLAFAGLAVAGTVGQRRKGKPHAWTPLPAWGRQDKVAGSCRPACARGLGTHGTIGSPTP